MCQCVRVTRMCVCARTLIWLIACVCPFGRACVRRGEGESVNERMRACLCARAEGWRERVCAREQESAVPNLDTVLHLGNSVAC